MDAMYIIPDSSADKDEEIPKILSCYQNALITIAVGGSTFQLRIPSITQSV
jgi:hypothetical protein